LKKFGVNPETVCNIDRLQGALDSLGEWAETWQLFIAVSKCCILNIGNAALCRPMCINGNTLPVVNTCRDLGVLISSDLSPSVHIYGIVAEAHQRANAILRCFVSRNPQLLTRAYTVMFGLYSNMIVLHGLPI